MSVKEEMVSGYLNNICSLIKNKRVHSEIKSEIKSHLEELEERYEKDGVEEGKATELALKNLGNPKTLGEKLNKVHKARLDFILIIATSILVLIGFIGTYTFNKSSGFTHNSYTIHDLIWAGIIIIFFLIGVFFDFRKIKKYSILLYLFGCVLALIGCFTIKTMGGVAYSRGIPFVPIPLNVGTVGPYVFLFSIAAFYERLNWSKKSQQLIGLVLGLVPLIMMMVGTEKIAMYLCYSIALMTLIYIQSRRKIITCITGVLEIIIFLLTGMKALNNMILHSQIWSPHWISAILGSSKLFGVSGQYIQYKGSNIGMDYAILNIISEYGWIVGIIVIGILLYFIWRLIKVPYVVKSIYGKSISASIAIMISVETIWSILMNLNVIPYTLTPVLFLSYGTQGMILSSFLIGLMINIYKVKTISKI